MELRDYFRPESDLLEDVAGAIKVLYLFSRIVIKEFDVRIDDIRSFG